MNDTKNTIKQIIRYMKEENFDFDFNQCLNDCNHDTAEKIAFYINNSEDNNENNELSTITVNNILDNFTAPLIKETQYVFEGEISKFSFYFISEQLEDRFLEYLESLDV